MAEKALPRDSDTLAGAVAELKSHSIFVPVDPGAVEASAFAAESFGSTPSPSSPELDWSPWEFFEPTGLARGPWHDDAQHGAAMLGLLGRAVERHPAQRPVQVTRLTVDLLRAAPLSPVATRCRTIRSGKNVEVLEASLVAGGREYARATASRFRVTEIEVEDDPAHAEAPTLPDASPTDGAMLLSREAFHHAAELRSVPGLEVPAMWIRLRVPLVADEETTPLQRVAAASDSTYSVPFMARVMADPSLLGRRRAVAINPDTSVNLHRPLRGEWVCLQGWSHQDASGAGTAFVRVFDRDGPIGHASQSILVRGPEARPESWNEFEELARKRRG